MEYKKYNLYRAFIKTNNPQHNNRPVLLLEDDHSYKVFDIYNITHDDRSENKEKKNANYPYNYPIKKWKEAGLDKPSLIKAREILNIDRELLFEKIGELQPEDIKGLEELEVKMYEDDKKALEKYNKEFKNKIEFPQAVIEQVSKDEYNPYFEALNDTTEVKPVDIEAKYRKIAEEMEMKRKETDDNIKVNGKESSAYENDERENDGR